MDSFIHKGGKELWFLSDIFPINLHIHVIWNIDFCVHMCESVSVIMSYKIWLYLLNHEWATTSFTSVLFMTGKNRELWNITVWVCQCFVKDDGNNHYQAFCIWRLFWIFVRFFDEDYSWRGKFCDNMLQK